MKIKELTFAIFIVKVMNDMPHLFMIHSTGNNFWDVPKGGSEGIETAIEAALRELMEEAGIIFVASDLKDLGVFEYNARKDMHVFQYVGDQYPDPTTCVCVSTFTCPYTQREKPEADGFAYIPFDKVSSHCAKSFNKVFEAFLKINESRGLYEKKRLKLFLNEGAKACDWDAEFKYDLLLNYLESHCPDKTEHFEDFIQAIVKTEDSLV